MYTFRIVCESFYIKYFLVMKYNPFPYVIFLVHSSWSLLTYKYIISKRFYIKHTSKRTEGLKILSDIPSMIIL